MDPNFSHRHPTLQSLIDSQTIVSTYSFETLHRIPKRFIQDYLIDQEMEIEEEIIPEPSIVEEYEAGKRNPHAGFFNFVNDSSDNKELPERRDSSVESMRIVVKKRYEVRSDSEDSIRSNHSDFKRKESVGFGKQQVIEREIMEVEEPKVMRQSRYKRVPPNPEPIKQKTQVQQHYYTRRHYDIKEFKETRQMRETREVKDPERQKYLTKEERIQKVREVGCNCKKSQCLKMYCQCFHLQIFCGSNCSCKGCGNLSKTQYHDLAVIEALTRNPKAFQEQNPQTCFKLNVGLEEVKRGCRCKKTKCLKKYCECFNSGEKCGIFCKCEGCENVGESGEQGMMVEMEIET